MDNIIRKKSKNGFTVVNNDFVNDRNLSLKGKGLIIQIMSFPDDWDVYQSDLIKRSKDGREAVASGIKELIKNGYCQRTEVRNKGKFAGVEYTFADYRAYQPLKEKPDTENPFTVKPDTENPPLLNTNTNKELIKQNTSNRSNSENSELSPKKEIIKTSEIENKKSGLVEEKKITPLNPESIGNEERKKVPRKKERKPRFEFEEKLIDLGVSENIASDWMIVRREKKASSTETSFNATIREIKKAGISVESAIIHCAENSWKDFKAEWYRNSIASKKPREATKTGISKQTEEADKGRDSAADWISGLKDRIDTMQNAANTNKSNNCG